VVGATIALVSSPVATACCVPRRVLFMVGNVAFEPSYGATRRRAPKRSRGGPFWYCSTTNYAANRSQLRFRVCSAVQSIAPLERRPLANQHGIGLYSEPFVRVSQHEMPERFFFRASPKNVAVAAHFPTCSPAIG